jgi:hypothetical protein
MENRLPIIGRCSSVAKAFVCAIAANIPKALFCKNCSLFIGFIGLHQIIYFLIKQII